MKNYQFQVKIELLTMGKFKFLEKGGFKKLPKKTGIYCFSNEKKKKLYIGKATNIQDRVKNHFQQPGFKDYLFLDKVKKIGYIKTDSEIEALILEAHLIKKYQPKYNVLWRDDKNYFYVAVTEGDFPRIFLTHQPIKVTGSKCKVSSIKKKGILNTKYKMLNTEFVGPFVDGKALKKTLKILRKIFPYRTCKTLPKRPCLWYQLGRCSAPCLLRSKLAQEIPSAKTKIKAECKENAKHILKILREKKTQVFKKLKKEMKKAAKSKKFEKAAKIRDQIFALEKVLNNAKIFEIPKKEIKYSEIGKGLKKILKTKRGIKRIEAYDVSNISGKLATGAMVTFTEGLPVKEFYRKFRIKISNKVNDVTMLKEILSRRFKHLEWGRPDLILIDGGRAQLNTVLSCLKSGFKDIKVMAIAKRKNELYIKNKRPILLKNLPREIFNLILQLRDEAHRFALTYHKKLREKELIG